MSASPAVVNQPTPQQRRTTILAASVGTVIEWYDYMAYAFVAVTLAAVFFPAADTATAVLSALACSASPSCSARSAEWSSATSRTSSAAAPR